MASFKKPHAIAENLIKPSAMEMVKTVLGPDASKKLQQIPLSNNCIRNRINYMGDDIVNQLISDIKACSTKITIQLDESTDVENCSQLIAFVRYMRGDAIEEAFLFCKPLQRTSTARIFSMF
jgi:hypothetical protein